MGERRLRTAVRRKRERARFWTEHGEKVRLTVIAVIAVLLSTFIVKTTLG
jgi:cell division protein FtsL